MFLGKKLINTKYIPYLEVSMVNTPAMAVIHSINKLLKILSSFIFLQPPFACLAEEDNKTIKTRLIYSNKTLIHN